MTTGIYLNVFLVCPYECTEGVGVGVGTSVGGDVGVSTLLKFYGQAFTIS